ncbi:MAG TPA: hypothetical protein DEB35_12600, partial [Desulfuromonas sp.]|nr:hypothetical protein [Desulfuromonas sp.]
MPRCFVDWIRVGRKSLGWSQSVLGEKLGVSQVQVSLWESGKAEPSAGQEQSLRRLLSVAKTPTSPPEPVIVRKRATPAPPPPPPFRPTAPRITTPTAKESPAPMSTPRSTSSSADFSAMEDQLWEAADQLRANSKLSSSEYCMPVLGVIFLRHASNRYQAVLKQIQGEVAAGKMPSRPLVKSDFIKRRALMLPEKAQYEALLRLPTGGSFGSALVEAMNAIEEDFEPLRGQLPKDYDRFDNDLLEDLLRCFDSEALRNASGDIFGRIYEY